MNYLRSKNRHINRTLKGMQAQAEPNGNTLPLQSELHSQPHRYHTLVHEHQPVTSSMGSTLVALQTFVKTKRGFRAKNVSKSQNSSNNHANLIVQVSRARMSIDSRNAKPLMKVREKSKLPYGRSTRAHTQIEKGSSPYLQKVLLKPFLAERTILATAEKGPNVGLTLLDKVRVLVREGSFRQAIQLLARLQGQQYQTAVVEQLKGICWAGLKEYKLSVETIEKATTLGRRSAEGYLALAVSQYYLGRLEDSLSSVSSR